MRRGELSREEVRGKEKRKGRSEEVRREEKKIAECRI